MTGLMVFIPFSLEAASIKILKKSKNNMAIVELPRGMKVRPGQKIEISDGSDSSAKNKSQSSMNSSSRKNYLSLGVTAPKELTGAKTFSWGFNVGYGWNSGSFEFDPGITIARTSATVGELSASSTTIAGVLSADYNFTANDGSETFVPGLTAYGSFTKITGGTLLGYGGGLVGKFFVFDTSPTAIRVSSTIGGSLSAGVLSLTLNLLTVGLQTYF